MMYTTDVLGYKQTVAQLGLRTAGNLYDVSSNKIYLLEENGGDTRAGRRGGDILRTQIIVYVCMQSKRLLEFGARVVYAE